MLLSASLDKNLYTLSITKFTKRQMVVKMTKKYLVVRFDKSVVEKYGGLEMDLPFHSFVKYVVSDKIEKLKKKRSDFL